MKVLGLIPARGGSKGVKDKNIRIVAGEPLIHYSIKACADSQRLTKFVVSTDSGQIRLVSEAAGAIVVDRPVEFATDSSSVVDAALHALSVLEVSDGPYDAVMLVQPTAPVRTGKDIDEAIKLLENQPEIDGIVSVIQVDDAHPARMYRMDEHGLLESLMPDFETRRRQDLAPIYHRNGSIYLIRKKTLIEKCTFMPEKKIGLLMQSGLTINIDTERDLLVAEILLSEWKSMRLNE